MVLRNPFEWSVHRVPRRLPSMRLAFGAVVAVALGAPPAHSVTFSDDAFNPPDWTALVLWDTSTGGSGFSVDTQADGSQGDARFTTLNYQFDGTASQGITVGHLNANALYDPAVTGAIESVQYSFSHRIVSQVGATPGVFHGLVIRQGGSHFVHFFPTPTVSTAWSTGSTGLLTATDFSLISLGGISPVRPDFGPAAAPLQFGYVSSTASGRGFGSGTAAIGSAFDDWVVSVTPVPEPSEAALSVVALLAGALVRATAARESKAEKE